MTVVLLIGFMAARAQTITYDDFKGLIPYLQSEDWKSAFKQSSKLLKSANNDTSDIKAIILYINIFSAAGMVSEGEMTYKELEKNVMKYKGQKIIMAAHPVLPGGKSGMNQIAFKSTDTTNEASTTATNAKATSILCFEYFYFNHKIDIASFGSSVVRCGGILEKIEPNPHQSNIWILRLTVKDAFARKAN